MLSLGQEALIGFAIVIAVSVIYVVVTRGK